MPKGVGYEGWYDGAVDPAEGYAHEYKRENTAKGTHPYPGKTASGKTSIPRYGHPTFGQGSGS